ncbi:orotidine-5'-phosphate decarboxylase [Lactobacillus sp. YT155]|uniref:orotidine-5'-phosphate decarboxylase n=1 Tax=Lactobacillus sp. YT155 TaxID=3060955 RepID=UPI00265DEE35|nr:orotidine-5'-phosphate decarboxylase [Lactobacillus sp. YT155]MDO1604917.1 orotidine-5'-phosphate decarboxylase [Lactobacillus sp. YT155]
MNKPLIIALDFQEQTKCLNFLKSLMQQGYKPFVKVGLEMFINYGQDFIKALRDWDLPVFLDLKLNDIPNTVERTCEVIAKWNITYLTVHANGGSQMIAAAKRGLQTADNRTKLLAVTQLTSLDDNDLRNDFKIEMTSQENVFNLAQLAFKSGADGVICSAAENLEIKAKTSTNFLCINPGIRPAWSDRNEQKRVVTPTQAKVFQSDGIVVGRPITQAQNEIEAYRKIQGEWN